MKFFRKHRKQKPSALDEQEKKILDLIKGTVEVMAVMGLSRLLPPAFREGIHVDTILKTFSPDDQRQRSEKLKALSMGLFDIAAPFMAYRITTTTKGNNMLH